MAQLYPVLLLIGSNIFMTYAWYGHLRDLNSKPLLIAVVLSWAVAFFEYCLQVPANRFGYGIYTLGQLKVMQEIITICVFAAFSFIYMKEKLDWNFFCAGLCLIAAAFFIFKAPFTATVH